VKWTAAQFEVDKGVRIPDNWLFLHYYDALSILFRIENALRTFVYVVLKAKHKDDWRALTIGPDEGGQTAIDAVAKRRAAQDDAFGYLGYTISSPLMYLTSGELIRLVLSEAYWPLFAPYFPTTKSIVATKLEEIGNVRNALAHFRPLKPDDVEVVRQNANQVLSRVEETLVRIANMFAVVPTNTEEPWYRNLRGLTTHGLHVSFQQSDDERWVAFTLSYDCPIISEPDLHPNYRHHRVLIVLTPPILRASQVLRESTVFASESIPYATAVGDEQPRLLKEIQFSFSRETLSAEHERIKSELERLLAAITAEKELITEDNLARGEFVRTAWVSSTRAQGAPRWQVDTTSLQSPISPADPVEYWAGKPIFTTHFLTDTESYPWMPVNVSNLSLPF